VFKKQLKGNYSTSLLLSILFFLMGLFYTHFFEWWFHHGPMHRRMRLIPEAIKLSHLEHHRVFHGNNYRSDDPEDLKYITGAYYRWPISFLVNYLLFIIIFPMQYGAIFFLGVFLHFTSYEVTHWFSHREADNLFDKTLSHIPIINKLREIQIEHHRIHHEEPRWDFAFNPPYLFDHLFGTFKR